MSRNLFARIGGTAVAVAALSVTMLATSASAGPPPGEDVTPNDVVPLGPYCANGFHCVFLAGLGSARHSYFNSDTNFAGDTFDDGTGVNNYVWSASNSSTGGYESHYYYGANYSGGLVFCVNPGGEVVPSELTDDGIDGNGVGRRDEASSLRLRPGTTISCFN